MSTMSHELLFTEDEAVYGFPGFFSTNMTD
ncbi:hypothetical protein MB901379_04779 [Mycobacterium basiliense]|uniref:Uncharacterized protein n=1 Tax=Mycobacterium basiliense TaxID=2094119 RepID=A0A3S4D032_9MYCO|nr:hypothetical protein MB901379_04779 [Mycobacterium basiliense]